MYYSSLLFQHRVLLFMDLGELWLGESQVDSSLAPLDRPAIYKYTYQFLGAFTTPPQITVSFNIRQQHYTLPSKYIISHPFSTTSQQPTKMSNPALEELTTLLSTLSLPPLPTPALTKIHPLPQPSPPTRPLDIARLYLAHFLHTHVPTSTPSQAYSSIVWPANIYNGDLTVILPKLYGSNKVSNKKEWPVIAFGLAEKVCPPILRER